MYGHLIAQIDQFYFSLKTRMNKNYFRHLKIQSLLQTKVKKYDF